MQYRLRTLLILMAILPPLLAVGHWQWSEYKARQAKRAYLGRLLDIEPVGGGVLSILTDRTSEQIEASFATAPEPNP
jgi:hypothetical protein